MAVLTYALVAYNPDGVLRSDGVLLSQDPDSPTWADYQAWLAAGNAPTPVPAPPRATLDAAIGLGCDAAILAGFSAGGACRRASMSLWFSTVLAEKIAGGTLSSDDQMCLTMAPLMNTWEGAMFVERDRLRTAGLILADANWPALPDGGAAFVAACGQG